VYLDCFSIAGDITAFIMNEPRFHAFRLLRLLRFMRIGKDVNIQKIHPVSGTSPGSDKIVTDNGHVYWYAPRHLFSHGWFKAANGTVLRSSKLWGQILILSALSTLYASRLCTSQCDIGSSQEDCSMCARPIGDGPIIVATLLVAAFLGLLLHISLSRWWEIRAYFQNLTSNMRDFIQMLLAYVPSSDETSIDFREKAIRLQIAAFIMFTQAIRGERDLKLLTYQGLLTLKERKKLKTVAGCYYLAYSWIRSDLWLFARRHADRFVHPESRALCIQGLEKSISSQQSNIENMLALIETPVPYIYTHLMAILAKFELVLVSIWISEILRYGFDQDTVESIVLGYVIIVGLCIIVEGILEVHSSLSTPFGYTAVDFPLHLYVRSTVALVDDTVHKIHPYGKPKFGTETKFQDGGSGSRLRRNDQDMGSGSKLRRNDQDGGSGSRLRRNDQDMGSGSKCRRTQGQDPADGGSGSKTNKSSISKIGFYEVKHSKASSASKIGGYEAKDFRERDDTLKMSGISGVGVGRRGSF